MTSTVGSAVTAALTDEAIERARGAVFWLTGVPASGKTTLAAALVAALRAADVPVLWLDSDDLRAVMTPASDFGERDRAVFYDTIAHLAIRAAQGGVTTVISATAPHRAPRDRVRAGVPCFCEVWLTCDPAALRGERDVKALYARADAGEITRLPGIGVEFEAPTHADALRLDSTHTPPERLLAAVIEHLAVVARG